MKIEFLDEAQFELDEAIEYYNNEVDGLGDAFLQEVLNTIDRIAKFPDALWCGFAHSGRHSRISAAACRSSSSRLVSPASR